MISKGEENKGEKIRGGGEVINQYSNLLSPKIKE